MFNIYTIQHFTFKVYNKKHEFKIKVKYQAQVARFVSPKVNLSHFQLI